MDNLFLDAEGRSFRNRIFEAMKEYSSICSQASLEKASENTIHLLETYNAEHIEIKAEITDNKNIILL